MIHKHLQKRRVELKVWRKSSPRESYSVWSDTIGSKVWIHLFICFIYSLHFTHLWVKQGLFEQRKRVMESWVTWPGLHNLMPNSFRLFGTQREGKLLEMHSILQS